MGDVNQVEQRRFIGMDQMPVIPTNHSVATMKRCLCDMCCVNPVFFPQNSILQIEFHQLLNL